MFLDDLPPYEALSYTWGTNPDRVQIILDGKPFPVTINLERALQSLRHRSLVKTMWIDAVCIDQDNLVERSKQILNMRTIYHLATRVISWLGPATPSSTEAFSLLYQLDAALPRQDRQSDVDIRVRALIHDGQNLSCWRSLGEFLNDAYWHRVWIVQEVLMAKTIKILCGKDSITWADLSTIQEWLLYLHNDLEELVQRHLTLGGVYRWVHSGPRAMMMDFESVLDDPPPLLDVIARHRKYDSSDPRDKIYALVGLTTARNHPEKLVIDYDKKDVPRVYIDVVKYVVETTDRLDIICACKRVVRRDDLPSWAPDWSAGETMLPIFDVIETDTKAEVSFESDGFILNARGFCIDKIVSLTEEFEFEGPFMTIIPNTIKTFHSWRSFFQAHKGNSGYLVEDDYAFCRTLLCGKVKDSNLESENHLRECRKILGAIVWKSQILDPDRELDEELVKFRRSFSRSRNINQKTKVLGNKLIKRFALYMNARRFFISSGRRIGIVENDVVKGDMVCILRGCSRPVILRPRKAGGFIFVGGAYMDKYGDGRAEEELKDGKYELQNFEIH